MGDDLVANVGTVNQRNRVQDLGSVGAETTMDKEPTLGERGSLEPAG